MWSDSVCIQWCICVIARIVFNVFLIPLNFLRVKPFLARQRSEVVRSSLDRKIYNETEMTFVLIFTLKDSNFQGQLLSVPPPS